MFTIKFYRKAGWITCFSIFLLVLLGGIVRASGSGMGCPDWPKCFGQYIPPTDANQLPENYQEIFLNKRLKKTEKYVKLLHQFGMHEKANAIANDPCIKQPEEFTVKSTWIEYLNRLFGALTGLFALAAFISSFQFIKSKPKIFMLTLLGMIAILFNAWMGSVVVATNLLPGTVTIHYLAAFLAVSLFMWPITNAIVIGKSGKPNNYKTIMIIAFFVILLQTITGTWSREIADNLIRNNEIWDASHHLNLKGMGLMFIIHRYLSIIVLGLIIYLIKKNWLPVVKKHLLFLSLIIVSQIIAGSINIFYVLPPIAQTYHIFAGGIILGIFIYLSIQIIKKTQTNLEV